MHARLVGAIILFFVVLGAGIMLWMAPAPERALPSTEESGDRVLSEETAWYAFTARYPARPLADKSARANAAALSTIEAWIASTTDEFRSFSDTLPGEEKSRIAEAGRKYELGISYISYASGETRSIEFDIYMDTGGAHPNVFFHTFVFDESGAVLAMRDLFAEGAPYLETLHGESLEHVRAEAAERLGEDIALFEEGLDPEEDNFSNFVLDNNSLVLLIPPYQAAAYAAGSFTVRIPLEDMRDILNQKLLP